MRSIILISLLLFLPAGSQDQNYLDPGSFEDPFTESNIIDEPEESSIEDDFLSLEPDIFSRKLYQKNLRPLTGEEKIRWSFRMADTDIFL